MYGSSAIADGMGRDPSIVMFAQLTGNYMGKLKACKMTDKADRELLQKSIELTHFLYGRAGFLESDADADIRDARENAIKMEHSNTAFPDCSNLNPDRTRVSTALLRETKKINMTGR
jgi:hypothetical protein